MKYSKGQTALIIILLIVIIGSFALVGGLGSPKKFVPPPGSTPVNLQDVSSKEPKNSLQLKALEPITSTPNKPISLPPGLFPELPLNNDCDDRGVDANGWALCIGKPVIYLYPKEKTIVDVKVETSGKIVVSDPLYPKNGWRNVTAYPDGMLIYKNQKYRELFYETSAGDIKSPEDGIVVKSENIEPVLRDLTNNLGLISSEQEELIDFWQPKLKALNSPYIFISVLDTKEKEKIDRVVINPKPDTMIDFILYFKPLNKLIEVKPLIIREPIKRTGFTAVEWGGTIAY